MIFPTSAGHTAFVLSVIYDNDIEFLLKFHCILVKLEFFCHFHVHCHLLKLSAGQIALGLCVFAPSPCDVKHIKKQLRHCCIFKVFFQIFFSVALISDRC